MSAERLRQAAALLRERADVEPGDLARCACGHHIDVHTDHHGCISCQCDLIRQGVVAQAVERNVGTPLGLAVADLLEHAAARGEAKVEHGGKPAPVWSHERDALAVADAVLGGAR